VGPHEIRPLRSPVTSAETSHRPVSRHRSPRTELCMFLSAFAVFRRCILLAGHTIKDAPRSATFRAASGKSAGAPS
jgi:hypothetical protein